MKSSWIGIGFSPKVRRCQTRNPFSGGPPAIAFATVWAPKSIIAVWRPSRQIAVLSHARPSLSASRPITVREVATN